MDLDLLAVRVGQQHPRQMRILHHRRVQAGGPQSVREHEHILDLLDSGADAADVEIACRRHRNRTLYAFLDQEEHHD